MVLQEADARAAFGLTSEPGKVASVTDALFDQVAGVDPAGAMMYVDLNGYLRGDILMLLDKMTMAVSLEARVPFSIIALSNSRHACRER